MRGIVFVDNAKQMHFYDERSIDEAVLSVFFFWIGIC